MNRDDESHRDDNIERASGMDRASFWAAVITCLSIIGALCSCVASIVGVPS